MHSTEDRHDPLLSIVGVDVLLQDAEDEVVRIERVDLAVLAYQVRKQDAHLAEIRPHVQHGGVGLDVEAGHLHDLSVEDPVGLDGIGDDVVVRVARQVVAAGSGVETGDRVAPDAPCHAIGQIADDLDTEPATDAIDELLHGVTFKDGV